MKAALVAVLAAAVAAATATAGVTPPRELVLFGYAKSLTKQGRRFELRVDPAEYLSGETANRAAIEDGVIPPGDVVPNDHYIRNEGHKLLTYRVPLGARVTVLTNDGKGPRSTRIPVSELAQIVKGRNPKHRKLFEPKNGFWIRVASDTVRAMDQQYSP